ncbi:MAG: hypothetical protein D6755_01005 [Anaerolineae bacterium]|nr:MAG: hypothetical protein D6755_01005 [Anaerolineae bacterium]
MSNQQYTHRLRLGLIVTVIGFLLFVLGAAPDTYGLDRSPPVGFLQIAVFLVGLAVICLGGYIALMSFWRGRELSIAADIGLRLVSTGYVIAFASGMADIFGFGTQPLPQVPYFGAWQETGVLIGEAVIGLGFLLMIPFSSPPKEDASQPAKRSRKKKKIHMDVEEKR